jgi:hypothetical protein
MYMLMKWQKKLTALFYLRIQFCKVHKLCHAYIYENFMLLVMIALFSAGDSSLLCDNL